MTSRRSFWRLMESSIRPTALSITCKAVMKLLSGSEIAARLWQNKNPPHSQSTRAIPFKYFELQKRRTKLKNFITKYFSGVPSVAKVTNLLFLLRSFETLSAKNREQEKKHQTCAGFVFHVSPDYCNFEHGRG